jgi:hypothetical protein
MRQYGKTPLYKDCLVNKLEADIMLLEFKSTNRLSDKGFDQLLGIVRKRVATSWLESWTNSVGQANTAGLSHTPAVLVKKTLSAWATNGQCWSRQHYRLVPQTGNIGSTGHCRVEAGTDSDISLSLVILSNRQWCELPITAGTTVDSKSGNEGGFESTLMSWPRVVLFGYTWLVT